MLEISQFETTNKIITGYNSIEKNINSILKEFSKTDILIITDNGIINAGLIDKFKKSLNNNYNITIFSEVEPDPSIETAEKCIELINENGFELIIGLGGGSVIDISKISSTISNSSKTIKEYLNGEKIENSGLPFIAIPTTSGTGSEVTDRVILTDNENDTKRGLVSSYMLPDIAIIDPYYYVSIPPYITAYTGMDALTHLIEAYVSKGSNMLTDTLALHGIKLIGDNLREAVYNGNNLNARYNVGMASLLGGLAFNNAGLGAVHALALPVGAYFHLPHGVVNAILLPYVIEYNSISKINKFAKISNYLGIDINNMSLRDAALKSKNAVKNLSEDINIPLKIESNNINKSTINKLSTKAYGIKRLINANPREINKSELTNILNKVILY